MNTNSFKTGDQITLKLRSGEKRTFHIYKGDALLNGESGKLWLKTNSNPDALYLRKTPEKPLSIGIALFHSMDDLHETLKSGNYYIA